jgi:hypothetical protein
MFIIHKMFSNEAEQPARRELLKLRADEYSRTFPLLVWSDFTEFDRRIGWGIHSIVGLAIWIRDGPKLEQCSPRWFYLLPRKENNKLEKWKRRYSRGRLNLVRKLQLVLANVICKASIDRVYRLLVVHPFSSNRMSLCSVFSWFRVPPHTKYRPETFDYFTVE